MTGSASFSDCTGLTELTIPASVEWVNELDTCSSLTAIHVDSANPNYCDIDGVLFNKEKTEVIQYPPARQGAYAIPDGVTGFSQGFTNCTGVTSITVPASADFSFPDYPYYGDIFFNGCTSLTEIYVAEDNPYLYDVDGVLFRKENNELVEYPDGRKGPYSIPSGTKSIHEFVFSGNTNLTAIEFPNSLTSIGESAFDSCTSLTEVTIPGSITDINFRAFCDCTGLTSVTLKKGVTRIDSLAFFGCRSLTSVTVPKSVTDLGDGFGLLWDPYYGGPGWGSVKIDGFVLYGTKGSAAEEYAKRHNLTFVSIEDTGDPLDAVDTNGDGEISTTEAGNFYLAFANGNPPAGADVSGDGRVDIEDVLTVYLIASGQKTA